MSNTFYGIELGKRGVLSQKLALNAISNNVANVNTEGYSRQRVTLVASEPYTVSNTPNSIYQIGTGVDVESVRRERDLHIDRQMRKNLSELGYWEKDQTALEGVETLFPDSVEGGLQQYLNQFFNNWQDINENPLDPGLKVGIVENALALEGSFNDTYAQLNLSIENLDEDYLNTIDDIGDITKQIADLNYSISKSYADDSNVLLDRRDMLVDQLAKIVKIDVNQGTPSQHLIDISVNGFSLVKGVNDMFKTSSDEQKSFESYLKNDFYNSTKDSDDPENVGGSIGAIKYAKNQITKYADDMKKLAHAIAKEVNDIYDNPPYNDDPPVSRSDGKFFVEKTTDADYADGKIMELKVKSSSDVVVGIDDSMSGDTRIALAIAQLRNKNVETDDLNGTFESFYQGVLVTIGQESSTAGKLKDTSQTINDQIFNRRESVSGVSIDEEMTNLIQYQVAFQASAKVISTNDKLLETVLGLVQ